MFSFPCNVVRDEFEAEIHKRPTKWQWSTKLLLV